MKGINEIHIKFIDGVQQRYPTCGDYFTSNGIDTITITKQDTPEKNLLIAIHEFVEWALITKRGIKESDIDAFDIEWNKKAEASNDWFKDDIAPEPGWEPECPYGKEHATAEIIERILAQALDINWIDYDKNLVI